MRPDRAIHYLTLLLWTWTGCSSSSHPPTNEIYDLAISQHDDLSILLPHDMSAKPDFGWIHCDDAHPCPDNLVCPPSHICSSCGFESSGCCGPADQLWCQTGLNCAICGPGASGYPQTVCEDAECGYLNQPCCYSWKWGCKSDDRYKTDCKNGWVCNIVTLKCQKQ